MSLLNKKKDWMNESLSAVISAEDNAGDNNAIPQLSVGDLNIANNADPNAKARIEKNQSNNSFSTRLSGAVNDWSDLIPDYSGRTDYQKDSQSQVKSDPSTPLIDKNFRLDVLGPGLKNTGGAINKAVAWTKGGFGLSETKIGQAVGQELTELGKGFKDFVGKTGEWMKDTGNQKKLLNYGAVAGGIYNYAQGQKSYDKTLDSMNESINVLTDTRSKISGDLIDNLGQLRSDSSELSQNTATDLITKNRAQLQQGLDSNVDFSSGVIKNIVDQSTKDINTKLASTFRNQQMKLDTLVENNSTDAQSAPADLGSSIKDVRT